MNCTKLENGVSLRMEDVALKDSKYTNSRIKPQSSDNHHPHHTTTLLLIMLA
jgi:hypothetical protein